MSCRHPGTETWLVLAALVALLALPRWAEAEDESGTGAAADGGASADAWAPLYGARGSDAPAESVALDLRSRVTEGVPDPLWARVHAEGPARDPETGACRVLRLARPDRTAETGVPRQSWDVVLEVAEAEGSSCTEDALLQGMVGPLDLPHVRITLPGGRIVQLDLLDPTPHARALPVAPWESRWLRTDAQADGWTVQTLRAPALLVLEAPAEVMVRVYEPGRRAHRESLCSACECPGPLLRVDTGDPFVVALMVDIARRSDATAEELQQGIACAHVPNIVGMGSLGVLGPGEWVFPGRAQFTVATRPVQ